MRGSGFDALPNAGTSFARCRWGSIYNESTDTVPTLVTATMLVCPTAPLSIGDQNLSLAFNMLDFIATDLRIRIYAQAHSFAQVPAQG